MREALSKPLNAPAGGRIAARVLRSLPELDSKTGAWAVNPAAAVRGDRNPGLGMLGLAAAMLVVGHLIYLGFFGGPGGGRGPARAERIWRVARAAGMRTYH